MRLSLLFTLLFLVSIHNCIGVIPPAVKREIRAVWLTTLSGLDWPSTKAYNKTSIQKQKDELRKQLDVLQQAKFNVVFFQTRIRSTVIYPSIIEPWDACLTGHINKSPGYDPLAFAIEECHRRGLQLHAWVVAFPGHNFKDGNRMGKLAMQKREPSLCIKTNKFWMLNPGIPETADYLANICKEIVQNYDVDGIHLDYIRYPESSIYFNDNTTYKKYGKGMSQNDWRRKNITHVVETIYNTIKSIKPWVWLSCSPVGKYDNLPTQSSYGWNAFSTVYQDAQGWLNSGIMDMLVPMMYFQAGKNFYPFALDWKDSSNGRPIVNGLAAYKMATNEDNWNLSTIEKEARFSRTIQSGGQAYFRSRYILENHKSIYDFLKNDLYSEPALLPPMIWQDEAKPEPPQNLRIINNLNSFKLVWDTVVSKKENHVDYNIYMGYNYPIDIENPYNIISLRQKHNSYSINLNIPEGLLPYYAITAINKYGIESEPVYSRTSPIVLSKESVIHGSQITIGPNGMLKIPPNRAHYIYVTNIMGEEMLTVPFQETLDLSKLPSGIYTIYGLKKKGRYNVLGRYLKRQN